MRSNNHFSEQGPERFWIDWKPEEDPFPMGCAVVDEDAGGIIAYFSTEEDANLFIKGKNEK